jgi:pyruvate kinase
MIARGDLAVECSYEGLAEVQEEILRLCQAAHLPVIWATQALDHTSTPTRRSSIRFDDLALSESVTLADHTRV